MEKSDVINHSAIKDQNGNSIISYGPAESSPKYNFFNGAKSDFKHFSKMFGGVRGTNSYEIAGRDLSIKGVNTSMVKAYGRVLSYLSNKGLAPYSFAYSSCSTHAGLALWLSGLPNLFIHPYTLQGSIWLWNTGVTPALIQNSHFLQNR